MFTRITKDMELDEQEERIRSEPRLLQHLEWQFKRFIMQMKLPIYGSKQFLVNYHDSLAAFSTQVFSDSHQEEYENRKTRIDEAIAANKFNQLRLIDRISVKDPEYEALDVIDQELFLQADSSDFQTVINRLENKG